jgi:hypothetical protein
VSRHSLLRLAMMRRPWVVAVVCAFVLLVPVPMWLERRAEIDGRQGREHRTVVVLEVREQGNDDLVTATIEDRRIGFQRPGKTSVGDEVEVYRDEHGSWRSADDPPLWVPVAASALCWVPVGFVLWRYPGFEGHRRWLRRRLGGRDHDDPTIPPAPPSGPVLP